MNNLTRSEAHQLEILFFDQMKDMLYDQFLAPGQHVYHTLVTTAVAGINGIAHNVHVQIGDEIVVPGRYENEPFLPDSLYFGGIATAEDVGEITDLTAQLAAAYARLDDHAQSVANRSVNGTSSFSDTRAAISVVQALS